MSPAVISSPSSVDESFQFASGEVLNAVFASRLVRNLPKVESVFGVVLTARDNWIHIGTDSEEKREAVRTFLMSLFDFSQTQRRPLDQRDFENILTAYHHGRGNDLQTYFAERIRVSTRKKDISARTAAQLDYIRMLREKDVIFGTGPAGTGKTYLAMAIAVSELLAGNVSRLILTRPAREAGENLGFLPGTLEEKIMPYLRPLYDALDEMLTADEIQQFTEKKMIEVAPLAFMRGRTLNNAFIILDEAQNTTVDQMLMLLTRMGFDSRCVITGDPSQSDLPNHQPSGLVHALRKLGGIPEIGFAGFTASDVVRHPLVEKIINAYREESYA